MKFVPSIHDESLKFECDMVINDAGSRLLDIMINYYSRNSSNLRRDLYSKSEYVKSKLPEEQFTNSINKVRSKM